MFFLKIRNKVCFDAKIDTTIFDHKKLMQPFLVAHGLFALIKIGTKFCSKKGVLALGTKGFRKWRIVVDTMAKNGTRLPLLFCKFSHICSFQKRLCNHIFLFISKEVMQSHFFVHFKRAIMPSHF